MITGSIVALVTPMLDDQSLDWRALERLVEHHVVAGTTALAIAGTTGESPTLTMEEHIKVIEFAIDCSGGRLPIIAGTGSNSTHEAIELTVAAAEAGAESALLVTPYYNRPTQKGLRRHFETVASSVNIPIILYNVPSRTACDLHNETVFDLSQVDNIVGIKDATGDVDRGVAMIESLPPTFAVYSGDDATTMPLLERGAKGCISVTANVAAEQMAIICRLALQGDFEEAKLLDKKLQMLHQYLFVEPNPIPVKFLLGHMGLIQGGIRLPLTSLMPEHSAILVTALEASKL